MGKSLNENTPPAPLSCYAEPVVCSDQGTKTTLTDPSKRVAANEGNLCLPSNPTTNPCQTARCVNKECVPSAVPDEEKLECLSPEPAAGPCEKGQCKGGECKPAPDLKKQGTSCSPDDKGLCRTIKHTCSSAGSCDPKTTIDDGKECSPDPDGVGPEKALLGQPSSLPAAFLALFQGSSKPPSYNCNSSNCTLEYCGNGKVDQPSEDCDGDAYRDGVARNLPCNKEMCKTGSVTPVDSCSARSFNPPAPEGVTILSEDLLICGTKGPKTCKDMRSAADSRKTELLDQGYTAIVTSGYITCNPWNGKPCQGAEPPQWSLQEARVCYYSQCGDRKLTPNEECDGDKFKDSVKTGTTCDPKTCKVIPPADKLSCGDLSLSVSQTLNRQYGLWDISVSLVNKKDSKFEGYNDVAYIIVDQPSAFFPEGVKERDSWYNKNDWSCADLKIDPTTGLIVNPDGNLSYSVFPCMKFDAEGTKKLLESGSAVRDDNNPDFLIPDSSVTAASYKGTTLPAIRLGSIPEIPAKRSWTATTNAKLYHPRVDPNIASKFSGRLVCEPLDTCGDGKKGPSEGCDGSIPPGAVEGATCNDKCVIEFCGDGIVNRDEECDGAAFKQGSPSDARCDEKRCKIQTESCNYYQLEVKSEGNWAVGSQLRFTSGSQNDCIKAKIDEAKEACARAFKGFNVTLEGAVSQDYSDDCIALQVLGESFYQFGLDRIPSGWGVHEHVSTVDTNIRSSCSAYDEWGTCRRGAVIYDSACHTIEKPASIECSSAVWGWRVSPISLIWNSNAMKDPSSKTEDLKVVKFNLTNDPTKPWVIWKASGEKPLLVFDPSASGSITSGKQLFGSVFSGGKPDGRAWRNGFEALGTLDTDQDGKVAGSELDPLALWFDHNRDGISQPREVKRLSDPAVQVSALYYTDVVRDAQTFDVTAAIGYSRRVNDQVVSGIAVDWFTEGGASKDEVLKKLVASSTIASANSQPSGPQRDTSPSTPKGTPIFSDLSGVWEWRSEDPTFTDHGKFKPQGYLTFTDRSDGTVSGRSYVETPFDPRQPAKSQLNIVRFEGVRLKGAEGDSTITFTIRPGGESDPTTIKATAKFIENKLHGTSEVLVTYNGKLTRVSYTWIAHRVEQRDQPTK